MLQRVRSGEIRIGAVTYSLDRRMVECLATATPLDVFVETGTYEGDSVEAIRSLFDEIHTIEASEALAAAARDRFAEAGSINVHQGDSLELLPLIRRQLGDRHVVYWLDAHWCAGGDETERMRSQCPLLGEIAAIGSLDSTSAVLIDDARLFLAPPPQPHVIDEWPTFNEVLSGLFSLGTEHELMVVNDVIAFVPRAAAPAFRAWASQNGLDLLVALHNLRVFQEELGVVRAALEEQLAIAAGMNRLSGVVRKGLTVAHRLSAPIRSRR